MPILLACRELSGDAVAIYSGQRLDVHPEQGLVGECDFILARDAAGPAPARTPGHDPARRRRTTSRVAWANASPRWSATGCSHCAGKVTPRLYGCVTTGEAWQFLRLEGSTVSIDRARYYIDNVGGILAALQAIIAEAPRQDGPAVGAP